MKSHKSGQQKSAEDIQYQSLQKQNQLTDQAQGTYSQFEGPVDQSPFYKSLLTTGIENTSSSYDRARANTAQRARMAGFGYEQPVTQGAQSQLDAQEAESLAAVPRTAMTTTAPLAMEAAAKTGALGMGYGSQGMQALNLASDLQQKRSSADRSNQQGAANAALMAALMAA